MYSIKRNFTTVYNYLKEKSEDPSIHPFESLLISSFVAEKLIRRTLVKLMQNSGKNGSEAFEELRYSGISKINQKKWPLYDNNNKLENVIEPNDWNIINKVFEIRDHLVHGDDKIPSKKECRVYNEKLLNTILNIRRIFLKKYNYSGWKL